LSKQQQASAPRALGHNGWTQSHEHRAGEDNCPCLSCTPQWRLWYGDGMTTRVEQLEAIVSRQTTALQLQVDRVRELENEIAILKGGLEAAGVDAMAFLRSVYSDMDAPLNLKIQAAATVAKIQAGPKVVNQGFVLFDFLEKKRLERIAQAKTIDATPNPPTA
jgi:hypothetical protein